MGVGYINPMALPTGPTGPNALTFAQAEALIHNTFVEQPNAETLFLQANAPGGGSGLTPDQVKAITINQHPEATTAQASRAATAVTAKRHRTN